METLVLSFLQFDAQLCAGGEGEADVQDRMVEEAFVPVLDLLERNAAFRMNLGLPGHAVERLAGRHPEVLDRLRGLAESGQVELVAVQFGDALALAYPWRDLERSAALTREVYERHDLPLSDVAFAADGQFGEGWLQRLPALGYRTALLPEGLATAWWGATPTSSRWLHGEATTVLLAGGTHAAADHTLAWHVFAEGEGYATGGRSCALGEAWATDQAALAAAEAELLARVAAGARLVTISEYVAAEAATEPLPPVVDGGGWPADGHDLGRWMGGVGANGDEDDDGVLFANVRARHQLAAAELVEDADTGLVEEGWRALHLAEYSGGTGPDPLPAEVDAGIDLAGDAYAAAQAAVAVACVERGASWLLVDLATSRVTPDGRGPSGGGAAADAPFVVGFVGRTGSAEFTTTVDADVLALTVTIEAGEGPLEVQFPWDGVQFTTIPGLGETVVEVPTEAIVADPLTLPLGSGLLRLSDGVWLIKHTASTHLAGRFDRARGLVSFADATGSADRRMQLWRVVLGDAERAAAVARAVNETPLVQLSCPPGPLHADLPCGCASAHGSGSLGLLVGAWLLWRRRSGGRGAGEEVDQVELGDHAAHVARIVDHDGHEALGEEPGQH